MKTEDESYAAKQQAANQYLQATQAKNVTPHVP